MSLRREVLQGGVLRLTLDRPKAASAANLRLELGAGFVTVEAPLW